MYLQKITNAFEAKTAHYFSCWMDHYKCSWSKRLVAWSRFSHLVTAPQPLHNDSSGLMVSKEKIGGHQNYRQNGE